MFVVDDHAIVRHGLASLLAQESDLLLCGEAATYEEALSRIPDAAADVILLDITLKDRNGLDLIAKLRERGVASKVLVLSMHDEALYAEKALRAGAQGYVMKERADETIIEALRAVLAGQIYVSEDVTASMLRQYVRGGPQAASASGVDSLTEREREVFECLGSGLSTRQIAAKFGLSGRTVEVHRAHIKKKLGCEGAVQLLREAVRWVEAKQRT